MRTKVTWINYKDFSFGASIMDPSNKAIFPHDYLPFLHEFH